MITFYIIWLFEAVKIGHKYMQVRATLETSSSMPKPFCMTSLRQCFSPSWPMDPCPFLYFSASSCGCWSHQGKFLTSLKLGDQLLELFKLLSSWCELSLPEFQVLELIQDMSEGKEASSYLLQGPYVYVHWTVWLCEAARAPVLALQSDQQDEGRGSWLPCPLG